MSEQLTVSQQAEKAGLRVAITFVKAARDEKTGEILSPETLVESEVQGELLLTPGTYKQNKQKVRGMVLNYGLGTTRGKTQDRGFVLTPTSAEHMRQVRYNEGTAVDIPTITEGENAPDPVSVLNTEHGEILAGVYILLREDGVPVLKYGGRFVRPGSDNGAGPAVHDV